MLFYFALLMFVFHTWLLSFSIIYFLSSHMLLVLRKYWLGTKYLRIWFMQPVLSYLSFCNKTTYSVILIILCRSVYVYVFTNYLPACFLFFNLRICNHSLVYSSKLGTSPVLEEVSVMVIVRIQRFVRKQIWCFVHQLVTQLAWFNNNWFMNMAKIDRS